MKKIFLGLMLSLTFLCYGASKDILSTKNEISKNFYSALKEKKFLIAAHRGNFTGNVIDNTELSAIAALKLGADIIEIDSVMSTDGILYAYHDGEEKRSFKIEQNLKTLSSKEIEELEYFNCLGQKSGQKVIKLEDLLLKLKGKCFINLDRSWNYLDKIFPLVKKLGMENQVIIKTHPTDKAFDFLKNSDIKLMYMVIASKKEDISKFMIPEINLVAAEILFKNENDEIINKEFLDSLKDKNIKIWINSLNLGKKSNLNAHYDDNLSIANDGAGWKWLVGRGADIIQTDWPRLVKDFRDSL